MNPTDRSIDYAGDGEVLDTSVPFPHDAGTEGKTGGPDGAHHDRASYLRFVSVASTLLLWFLLTEDGLAIVQPIKFPSPRAVVEAAVGARSLLLADIAATMRRVAIGLAIGTALGMALGLWMSFSRSAYHFFDPIVESMRPVPVIAMIPFFLLWFGIDEIGKILLIVLGVFAIIVVSTVEAVKNIPKIYLQAASALGADKNAQYRLIVVPAIIPGLIGPLRVSAALSFTLVVAAEFMGAQTGLGYRILEARRLFNPDMILLGVVLIGLLSGLVDALMRRMTRYLTRWSERD